MGAQDDAVARMKLDTLMHMIRDRSYVGHEAAELLAVGLMTPVYIVEPQLYLQGVGAWRTSSLEKSHGRHFTPASHMVDWPEWPKLEEVMLRKDHGRCNMPRPLVVMHVLSGAEAEFAFRGFRSFNHFVAIEFLDVERSSPHHVNLDEIRVVAQATDIALPSCGTRQDCAVVDLTHSRYQAVTVGVSSLSDTESVYDPPPISPVRNASDGSDNPDGPTLWPGDDVDVSVDFQPIIAQAWKTREELFDAMRAVFAEHGIACLCNPAKVSGRAAVLHTTVLFSLTQVARMVSTADWCPPLHRPVLIHVCCGPGRCSVVATGKQWNHYVRVFGDKAEDKSRICKIVANYLKKNPMSFSYLRCVSRCVSCHGLHGGD